MFIGTGACRDRVRHFDDQDQEAGRERRGPDERERRKVKATVSFLVFFFF